MLLMNSYLKLIRTRRQNSDGLEWLDLALMNGDRAVDRVQVYSGQAYAQDFFDPTKDYSGSMRPIPEGVYQVGEMEYAPSTWGEGLGARYAALDVLPQYRANNRSAIGLHLDANRSYAPGSAGCIVTVDERTLDRVVGWLDQKSQPRRLVVDYGLGFLVSRGYTEPWRIAA
jgi:hypothetical protein